MAPARHSDEGTHERPPRSIACPRRFGLGKQARTIRASRFCKPFLQVPLLVLIRVLLPALPTLALLQC